MSDLQTAYMTLGQAEDFLKMIVKIQSISEKLNKLDLIKIQNFHISKDTSTKMKWQATDKEKIFAKYVSIKNSYPEYIMIYNDLV